MYYDEMMERKKNVTSKIQEKTEFIYMHEENYIPMLHNKIENLPKENVCTG